MQWRNAVDGLQTATCRHHIETVSAVTGDVEVVFWVAVLHHHDEAGPSVGQVVARHSFTALGALTTDAIRHAEDACIRCDDLLLSTQYRLHCIVV